MTRACKLRSVMRNIPGELAVAWSIFCFVLIILPVALPIIADLLGFLRSVW